MNDLEKANNNNDLGEKNKNKEHLLIHYINFGLYHIENTEDFELQQNEAEKSNNFKRLAVEHDSEH